MGRLRGVRKRQRRIIASRSSDGPREREECEMDNRDTLQRTLEATFRGDFDTAMQAFADDGVVEWPQSGERIVGREACLVVYKNYPGGSPGHELLRITGWPDTFTVEAIGYYS